MSSQQNPSPESDLPVGMGAPARRALIAAGYVHLQQLTELTEADLLKLHGVGPKGIRQLRQALAEQDLSFKAER